MAIDFEVQKPKLRISSFQQRVLELPLEFDIALLGGRGGGKSYAIALLALMHAERYGPEAKMLYLRLTHQATRDFVAITRKILGLVYGKAATFNASTGIWLFPGGGFLEINQLEDDSSYLKFQGRSYSWICADEAQMWPDLALVDSLRSNLRGPNGVTCRFILSANPGGPSHSALTSRFINVEAADWEPFDDKTSGRTFVRCPSTFADNPFQSPEYESQILASTVHDSGKRRAWLFGDWSAMAAGSFFCEVLNEENMLDPFP